MNRFVAESLRSRALEVARWYSNPVRQGNLNGEEFRVEGIKVLSDGCAAVNFLKVPGGKFALAFFYYVAVGGGRWEYFFPTDSHLLGMRFFPDLKLKIEEVNLPLNYEDEEVVLL